MSNKILEEIYFGELGLDSKEITSPEFEENLNNFNECNEILHQYLNKEQSVTLLKMVDSHGLMMSHAKLQAFIDGFKLCSSLFTEVLKSSLN